jgi:hypothetical protein
MSVKILGDAPAMAMGNLFWTWAKYGGDVRTQGFEQELFESLIELQKETSPDASGGESMYAAPVWFDGQDGTGQDPDGGQGGGRHQSSHGGDDGAGLSAALSLFKAVGHGDLDI